ncbi:MAG: ATP-binding protein [Magnetococcales bacterium]|nr:ATP-binding protein [Magnetococcales bacterium]
MSYLLCWPEDEVWSLSQGTIPVIAIQLRPYKSPKEHKGLLFPPDLHLHRLLVVAPPGTGKTTLIRRLGGWVEEGCVNLANNRWWQDRSLAFRPRELHLLLPFVGLSEACSVYDPLWLHNPTPLDFRRIHVPPPKNHLLAPDWRVKLVLEFLLPPPEQVFARRQDRVKQGTHPLDLGVTLEDVTKQLLVYWNTAKHLHRCGLDVYIRKDVSAPPLEIIDTMDQQQQGGQMIL